MHLCAYQLYAPPPPVGAVPGDLITSRPDGGAFDHMIIRCYSIQMGDFQMGDLISICGTRVV